MYACMCRGWVGAGARERAWVRVCARVGVYYCLSLRWEGWEDGRGHANYWTV